MVTRAVSLLESMCISYPDIKDFFSLHTLHQLWVVVAKLLSPNTDGAYLAVFLHLASTILENIGESALFVVGDLMRILPCALEKQNETCRAESCRCLGWLCSIFPSVSVRGGGDA